MSGPERREYCKDCGGDGARFLLTHLTDPSAKYRWSTCDRCGGDGFEPKAKHDDDEGDKE